MKKLVLDVSNEKSDVTDGKLILQATFISIFDMKFNLNVKYWIMRLFMLFLRMFLCSKYANCADPAFFGLNAVRSRSNDWNELVLS